MLEVQREVWEEPRCMQDKPGLEATVYACVNADRDEDDEQAKGTLDGCRVCRE